MKLNNNIEKIDFHSSLIYNKTKIIILTEKSKTARRNKNKYLIIENNN